MPDAPLGRVLIQIVAEGWKTYGKWYDITEAKEPIKIHLDGRRSGTDRKIDRSTGRSRRFILHRFNICCVLAEQVILFARKLCKAARMLMRVQLERVPAAFSTNLSTHVCIT